MGCLAHDRSSFCMCGIFEVSDPSGRTEQADVRQVPCSLPGTSMDCEPPPSQAWCWLPGETQGWIPCQGWAGSPGAMARRGWLGRVHLIQVFQPPCLRPAPVPDLSAGLHHVLPQGTHPCPPCWSGPDSPASAPQGPALLASLSLILCSPV